MSATALILCVDLDGTVLAEDGVVPQAELDELLALLPARSEMVVMTARPVQDVARLFTGVEGEVMVWASDGAVRAKVASGDITELGDEAVLDREVVRATVNQLLTHTLRPEVLVFSTSASGFEIVAHDPRAREAARRHLQRWRDARPLRYVPAPEGIESFLERSDVRAVACLGETAAIEQVAHDHDRVVAAQYLLYAESREPGLSWFDIVGPTVSKAGGVAVLRSMFPGSRVIAAGNAQNDVAMLRAADVGICPVDAEPAARKAASDPTHAAAGAPLVSALQAIVRREATNG